MRARPVAAAATLAVVLLAAEAAHWVGSRRGLGLRRAPGDPHVVVVLGYRNRGERANAINRHRVRAGLRSLTGPTSVLVLSGGGVAGPVPEAEVMARYARRRGYAGAIVLETASRSTWDNVRRVAPLVEGADTIAIVSDSLHALKARRYLRRLRPDLADRLVRGRDYRFGESMLLKPAMVVLAFRAQRRLRRARRRVGGVG